MAKDKVLTIKDSDLDTLKHTRNQVLQDVGTLIEDLLNKITANVEETGEKAAFQIKCELGTDREGNLKFQIGGKTTLSTETITRDAQIVQHQLNLF